MSLPPPEKRSIENLVQEIANLRACAVRVGEVARECRLETALAPELVKIDEAVHKLAGEVARRTSAGQSDG